MGLDLTSNVGLDLTSNVGMDLTSNLGLDLTTQPGRLTTPFSVPCIRQDFRVKNTDHMRPDVVLLLRGSERAFLRQLVCSSPAALFRWGILRATIRITAIFRAMARQRAQTGRPPQGVRSPVCLGENPGRFAG